MPLSLRKTFASLRKETSDYFSREKVVRSSSGQGEIRVHFGMKDQILLDTWETSKEILALKACMLRGDELLEGELWQGLPRVFFCWKLSMGKLPFIAMSLSELRCRRCLADTTRGINCTEWNCKKQGVNMSSWSIAFLHFFITVFYKVVELCCLFWIFQMQFF